MASTTKPSDLLQLMFAAYTLLQESSMQHLWNEMMCSEFEPVTFTDFAAAVVLRCCFDIVADDWNVKPFDIDIFGDSKVALSSLVKVVREVGTYQHYS